MQHRMFFWQDSMNWNRCFINIQILVKGIVTFRHIGIPFGKSHLHYCIQRKQTNTKYFALCRCFLLFIYPSLLSLSSQAWRVSTRRKWKRNRGKNILGQDFVPKVTFLPLERVKVKSFSVAFDGKDCRPSYSVFDNGCHKLDKGSMPLGEASIPIIVENPSFTEIIAVKEIIDIKRKIRKFFSRKRNV